MTPEQIAQWAREAGFAVKDGEIYGHHSISLQDCFTNFAALVASHELEMCAKVCDDLETSAWVESYSAGDCASAIRARGA